MVQQVRLDFLGIAADFDGYDVGGAVLDSEAAEGFCDLIGVRKKSVRGLQHR